MNGIAQFIKAKRKELGITQQELAHKAGLGLRFVRDCEQGKKTLRMDKVNQLLLMFGYTLGPERIFPENQQSVVNTPAANAGGDTHEIR